MEGDYKMAWQVKVLATEPGNLSSVLGIHVPEGEVQVQQVVL